MRRATGTHLLNIFRFSVNLIFTEYIRSYREECEAREVLSKGQRYLIRTYSPSASENFEHSLVTEGK